MLQASEASELKAAKPPCSNLSVVRHAARVGALAFLPHLRVAYIAEAELGVDRSAGAARLQRGGGDPALGGVGDEAGDEQAREAEALPVVEDEWDPFEED